MATYSSILAWKIPWTEEPGGLQGVACGATAGLQSSDTTACAHTHTLSLSLQVTVMNPGSSNL